MKITISLVKFLFIGALFIVSNENLFLNNPEHLSKFFELFYIWLSGIFSQAWQITGYVINSEWLPGNASTPIIETLSR